MRASARVGFWSVVAGVVCGFMFVACLDAAASVPPKSSSRIAAPAPKPTWIVVEVMNWKGGLSYEAILSSALHARIDQLHQDYLKAVEKWKKDKVMADIKNVPFDEKKPVPGYVKRVQTTPPSFKYQDLAAAEAAQLTKKMKEEKSANKP